ncbi:efflux RND transporter permease subunit [Reinekea sp.]|uniref:efflux RND transporter permease subunit n=1 Tax=Reinekea sp. TaxID=1970455 RepID=UPI002A82B524|nr:efflux RND transporter permease subunit [Reinekea sp.]
MTGIISAFAKHRIAPNAMMFIVIFLGLIGLDRLNTQFLPDFELNLVRVSTPWPGASAEDVQEGLSIPIERAILSLSDVKRVTTTSIEGRAEMTVTLNDSAAPIDQVMSDIESAIAVLSLPEGADETVVDAVVIFDPVADVLIYGDLSLEELELLGNRAEKSLKASGIRQVVVSGLPARRIEAELTINDYLSVGVGLDQIGQQFAGSNINAPAGITGADRVTTQIRVRNAEQTADNLARQTVTLNDQLLSLDQIARVSSRRDDSQSLVFYQDLPAVKLSLSRTGDQDTLEMADALAAWQTDFAEQLPGGAAILVYNETYKFVQSRVSIIINNGLSGLVLVLIVLFIFLNHRLAWWVAVGVPVSFLATFMFLELSGNSITVISLLGFLIALGVIVDDAIVVGENAYANMANGDEPEAAAIKAAKRMLPAVGASSVTTVAAFLPLLLVGGPAGAFTKGVPIVVIMAILASLIECFLILPGPLAHSFKKGQAKAPSRWRQGFERGFDTFRQKGVRRVVTLAVDYRATTFTLVIMALVLSILLVVSGRVKFVFFPAIQAPQLQLQAEFAEGTPQATIETFLIDMEQALLSVEREAGEPLVDTIIRELQVGSAERGELFVQLDSSPDRGLSNAEIISAWRAKVTSPAGLVKLSFAEDQQGPSSNGVSVRLVSENLVQLQAASQLLRSELAGLTGLLDIRDDLPLGAEQINLKLTADARALGLTPAMLARSLREFVDGYEVQSLQVQGEELAVVLRIRAADVDSWFALAQLPIALGNGSFRPLAALANPSSERAIQQLSRVDGELSAVITAQLANRGVNLTEINQAIDQDMRAKLSSAFPNVRLDVEGDQASQAEFFADVKTGGLFGLALIFITLAWVFESWTWPFAVISAIPFALTGAIVGHWVLGLDLSVLSIYGLFGLSGIVINDSIVLVSFYRELRNRGMGIREAVIEASVQRFRAVLLTTLTTVGGLTPLMFETSFDAQFLIPLAAGIAFGLMYGIVLILLFVPAMLLTLELFLERLSAPKTRPSTEPLLATID